MFYGTDTIHIDDDHTDRIGIRTLVLSQFWQPSDWPLADAQYIAEEPDIPAVSSGVILVGKQTRPQGGGLRTAWTFEGVDGDGKTVTFKDRNSSLDYAFEPGFAQVAIQLHPDYQNLLKEFQGQELGGQVYWAPYLSASGAGIGLSGSSTAGQTPNVMYGREDWLRMEGTYTFRYAATDPTSAMQGIGTIFESGQLPGKAPQFSDGRNWLKAPPPWRRRGTIFDITEIYWLSGPEDPETKIGGWPAPIYGGTSSASGTQGLQTGPLQGSQGSNFGFDQLGPLPGNPFT